MSRIPDHVENPAAYAAAIHERIKANAWITKRRNFERDYPELFAQLEELWSPRWNPDVEEWQQDGSHMILEHFTMKERKALLRKLAWLREGYEEYGSLTEKQAAKAKEIIEDTIANVKRYEDEDERRKANATPWENGRQEFACTVVNIMLKDVPRFSYYDSGKAWKMIVQNESGARLYCTAPQRLLDEAYRRGKTEWGEDIIERAARGMELVLRVNVERANDDPIFAFGKKPHIVSIGSGE